MMEGKKDRKDIDFLILMSTYLLNEDYSTINDKMTKLAELGQINAIQYFYLMKAEYEMNHKIDKKLKSKLKTEGFEVDLAVKNYLLAKQKTDDYYPELYKGIAELKDKSITEVEKNCFKKIKTKLEESKSSLLFQRYLEVKVLIGKKLTQTDERNLKKLRQKLLQEYKENPKDILVAFALGKNLSLFEADENHKILGKQILSEVSKQSLSKDLEEYMLSQTLFLKNQSNFAQAEKKKVNVAVKTKVEEKKQ